MYKRQMPRCGTDIQIGCVEAHSRADAVGMLKGLPVIPRRRVPCKGREIEEMDLDAVLQIHPEIMIADELARSNVEGQCSARRWQDVMELLDAGTNVFSTVNIQHIESLKDEIKEMVGIGVEERIPDRMSQEANKVVNINLTAEELLERLKSGKIYTKDRIQTTLDHFFQAGSILQLRELVLKEMAFRVRKKVEEEVLPRAYRIKGMSRIVVCAGSSSETQQRIIRKAARMVDSFDADLLALYVQTRDEGSNLILLDSQRCLMSHLELTIQLRKQVHKMASNNIPQSISEFCRQ